MLPKKKPLEDARKRLQEKLSNVEEQSEFICQFINDLVNKASLPAKKLLQEKDRKKFFQKYSSVSQELEKCLDCLLLISDSATAVGEEDTLGSNEDQPSSTSETSDNASDNTSSKQSVVWPEPQLPPQGNEYESVKGEKADAVCGQDKQESHHQNETVKVPKGSNLNRTADLALQNSEDNDHTADSQPALDISSAMSSGGTERVSGASQQIVLPATVGELQNETLLDKPDKTVQAVYSYLKTFTEEVLSPTPKPPHSRNVSDLTRGLQQSQHSKHLNQRHKGHVVSQRVQKTSEKKRSLSSSSVLSDLVQDFQVSLTEASTSADGKTARGVKLRSYPFINGEAIEVVVTEVISPWEFWVQPIGTELDLLMEEMCMHYAKLAAAGYKGGLPTPPGIGDFCCAKFTQDETWYRAMVTKVDESNQGTLVEVYCVDDGNRESLGLSRLRPLEEKFSKLPCQALCCALFGVRPIPQTPPSKPFPGVVSAHWGQKAVEWLKSKVSGQTLLGYPARTGASELIIIELYATSLSKERSREGRLEKPLPGLEFSISEMMLRAGMAQRAAQEQSSPSGSSLSGSSEESLSPSCSSASVGSSVQEGTASSQHNTLCASSKDDSCTDHSSSRETVTRTSERLTEDARVTAVKRPESEEGRIINDTNADNKDVLKEPVLSTSKLCDEIRKDDELRGQQKGPLGAGNIFSEYSPAPDPGDSYLTEPPLLEGPVCLQMLMSHVVSVSEFYVHLVTPQAGLLDPMMDALNSFYNSYPPFNGSSSGHSFQPQVGDYCCARFKEDRRWYRGLVTSLRCMVDKNEGPRHESLEVEVFHVDFGSSEWVTVGDVRPLVPKFRTMPGQVVRCQLADLVPVVTDDMETPEQDNIPGEAKAKDSVAPPEEKPHVEETLAQSRKPLSDTETPLVGTSRKKRGRRKRKQKLSSSDQNVVVREAGTESYDSSELSEVEFVKATVPEENEPSAGPTSSDKNAFPEKYLMPSPDRDLPTVNGPSADKTACKWAPGTSELFEGLTDESRVLVGYLVPWDPWVYQQLFNPTTGGLEGDITYKKPTLSLNLYDTTGDEDIFINQVLVEVGLANFVQNPDDPTAVDERKMRLTLADLESEAPNMEQKGFSGECSVGVDEENNGALVNSPTSPLKDWDPMKDDFLSSKNSYAVDGDDIDIAVQGYQDLSRRVCRFYNTQSGCWKGDTCPNLHVKKGDKFHDLVEVFCDNVDSSVTLPDVGTWVAVRVTAVFHPGHFWVQFPYGTKPIEERILAARMGVGNGDVEGARQMEDLDSLMEKMGRFYSRNVCQDPRRILPAVGELCVAKYSKDEKWYRARITCVREEELQVFFVDYGNSEWTPENFVKRMLPHFLHLPFQAVECFLGNVVPKEDAKENGQKYEWSKEALDTFHSLTEDKILIAHILSKAWNQTIYVDLFDTDKEEVHINKVLVDKGFAVESDHTVNNPWNIEATVQFNPHKMIGLPG